MSKQWDIIVAEGGARGVEAAEFTHNYLNDGKQVVFLILVTFR